MTIKEITKYIEKLAPLQYAEDFDNVGLLIGNYSTKISNVLVTLDTLEETIDEAIAKNCNLIISFHPIIFNGLKKLNGSTYVERVVLKAIKNDIAIYATHTALDNSYLGVSAKICEVLGLQNNKILIPKKGVIKKLTTYVPTNLLEKIKTALFKAGAGNIGNYDNCSFTINGKKTYRNKKKLNLILDKKRKFYTKNKSFLNFIFESKNEHEILNVLHKYLPYEEVTYDVVTTENIHQNIGIGMIGELPNTMDETTFLSFLKKTMNTNCVRHSLLLEKPIKKIAVLGGSGSFGIQNAINLKADVYISADFKYHDFFKAEKRILLADIGHYESELFTKNLLVEYLTKKITNFAVILSEKSTNPIYYL